MEWGSALSNLALTALVYGIAPIIFYCTRKRPVRKRVLKTFHIIYTCVVGMLFAVGSSFAGLGVSFTPAVLWGLLFYHVNRVKLLDKGLLIRDKEDHPAPDQNISECDSLETSPLDAALNEEAEVPVELPEREISEPLEPSTGKSLRTASAVIPVVLSVLLLASVAENVAQAILSKSLEETIAEVSAERDDLIGEINRLNQSQSSLHGKIKTLNNEVEENSISLYFYNKNIRFLVQGSSCYHKFDCPNVQETVGGIPVSAVSDSGNALVTQGEAVNAHDIEYCKKLGYTDCPICGESAQKRHSFDIRPIPDD